MEGLTFVLLLQSAFPPYLPLSLGSNMGHLTSSLSPLPAGIYQVCGASSNSRVVLRRGRNVHFVKWLTFVRTVRDL